MMTSTQWNNRIEQKNLIFDHSFALADALPFPGLLIANFRIALHLNQKYNIPNKTTVYNTF